jgi:translocation and assembly module TamB
MTPSADASPSSGRLRRARRWAGFTLLALLAAVALVYETRERWLGPYLARRMGVELSRATGAEVRLEALGGDWLRAVELRGLAWRDAREGAVLAELDARLARVQWSPWALLTGADDWLRTVELEGLRARLRAGGGREGREPSGPSTLELPERLPVVRIASADVELELGAGRLSLARAGLELDAPLEQRQPARLEVGTLTWSPREGRALSTAVAARLAWTAPRIEIERLDLDGVERLDASWVDLGEVARGDVSWSARLSAFGGVLRSRGGWREQTLDASVELDAVALRPALALLTPGLADPPQAVLDGSGTVRLVPDEPGSLAVTFTGRASDVLVAGRDIQEVEAEIGLAGSSLSLPRLRVRRGTGYLQGTDLTLPLGGDLRETLRAARGTVELVANDLPAWLGTPPPPDSLVARAPPHQLEVVVRLTEAGLDLERGRLATTGGVFVVRPSSVTWGPDERLLEAARLDIGLDLDFSDVSSLGPVLAIPGRWGGSLRGRLELDGTWGALVGGLEVAGLDVVAADLELGELEAVADIDVERIRIERFRSEGPRGELALEGAWLLQPQRFEATRLTLATDAPQRTLPGVFTGGRLELEAELEGAARDPRGSFTLRAEDVSFVQLEGEVLERLALAGRLEQGRAQIADLQVEIEGVEVAAAVELRHEGWQPPFDLRLDALAARRQGLDLVLQDPAEVRVEPGAFSTGTLRFAGSAGELELELAGRDGDLTARLDARRLDPMPLLVALVPSGFEVEGIQGRAALELVGGALRAEAQLDVERLVPAEGLPGLRLEARGTLADGRARLERLSVEADAGRRLELAGEAPLDPLGEVRLPPGAVALEGRFELDDLSSLPLSVGQAGLGLAGSLGVGFDLEGDWERLQGEAAVEGDALALVSRNGTPLFGPARLSARLECGEEATHLEEVLLEAPGQADLAGRGTLGTGLEPERWLGGDLAGLLAAPLELDLELQAADLGFFSRLLPGVRRIAGRIDGRVGLAGTLGSPQASARVVLADGELRLESDVPTFDAVRARLELEPGRLRLVELAGEMGGGPLEGSGELDWSGESPQVQLALHGEEVLLVQQPTLRVRADAELTVSGPLARMELAGRLGLREGRYTKRVELFRRETGTRAAPGPPIKLFSFDQGPLATMRLDVAIASLEPFRIENNLVDGSVRADLRLGGSGRAPELLGALFVDPTLVSLPATTLETTSGTLVFEREDPLMPQLDVRLETRVRSYDIAMRATGPLEDPWLELTSIPPLPNEDLLVLVLTGKPPELSWDARTGEDAAQTVAFFVGKDLLQEWFSGAGADQGASWLDRIEWRTGVDVTESGGTTSELLLRISGDARGAGRTVWLRAENDAYDRVNFGVRLSFRLR